MLVSFYVRRNSSTVTLVGGVQISDILVRHWDAVLGSVSSQETDLHTPTQSSVRHHCVTSQTPDPFFDHFVCV